MSTKRQRTVLISSPHALEHTGACLPYIWAILKTHWEEHGDPGAWKWLDPIFRNDYPDPLLKGYDLASIDVLGLSCYTWNTHLQCALAQRVKQANPACIVIAGGPDPDYKDPEFFTKHPYIDAIAVKDGEITFTRILERVANDRRDFDDIVGLYLPAENAEGHTCTGPAEVPKEFLRSPYVAQREYFEALCQGHGPYSFQAIWETNRGCPYSCSFCDWGSATMSKVRSFSMERVAAEIDFLGSLQLSCVIQADANFGILKRDVDIAGLVCDAHRTYGYPHALYFSAAKNNPDRVVEIAKKFVAEGLFFTHTLAVQHTDAEVLAATDRANISAEKQATAAKALLAEDIPIDVQLILGIPGDTYERWKASLAELMEWGVHEDYETFFYNLLPNAPAADKDFLRQWEMETIDRIILANTGVPWRDGDLDRVRMTESRLVVKSKTFSADDWARMWTYVSFVKALHNASLTRSIAIYLRMTHGIPYSAFYDDLIERFIPRAETTRSWHETVAGCYQTMLRETDSMDRIPVRELPAYEYALDPSRWLFVNMCLHADTFFSALRAHLLDRYPQVRNLASAIDYQKELVILPSYDRRAGKRVSTDLDWVSYFQLAKGCIGGDVLPEPTSAPGTVIEMVDAERSERGHPAQPLSWEDKSGEARWIEWIDRTVVRRNSAGKKNFQQIRLAQLDEAIFQ